MLEVNPNTVMRTYDFLQNKEIIFNKRGIGYSAVDKANEKILAYRKERFLATELPDFFKTMYLLDVGIDELQSRYQKFIEEMYPLTK
jgi:GntR family transcriptional regulator